ncbi:hypothetical protein L6452_14060 [Arctium lappa]|uniref:Uncharacterized protein n=1 Tax=Arctium lappa TaxID=4217 RepID=A0ACB9CJX8_ARCLA|nr:hypothetical protein L6452_14060 [Arctium lappa]
MFKLADSGSEKTARRGRLLQRYNDGQRQVVGSGMRLITNDGNNRAANTKKEDVNDGERTQKIYVGKEVRVVGGNEAGLKGRIVEVIVGGDQVVLKLSRSQEVIVRVRDVADLGSIEEERCLKKLKDVSLREKVNQSSGDRKSKDSTGSHNRTKRSRGRHEISASSSVSWLNSHIIARIISKEVKRGGLYLQKGVIVDVSKSLSMLVIPMILDTDLLSLFRKEKGCKKRNTIQLIPATGLIKAWNNKRNVFVHTTLTIGYLSKSSSISNIANSFAEVYSPSQQGILGCTSPANVATRTIIMMLITPIFFATDITGTWRRLFSRVEKHIIWGVLKSVTGMQGKKFKDKLHGQAKEATVSGIPTTDLNLSDSDGGPTGRADQVVPITWPKRPADGAGDGFVNSIRGLFHTQRRKAKAFVLRTMRGEEKNDQMPGDRSESDNEYSPFARKLTITKARKLIRRHTEKFRSKKQYYKCKY